jgi:ABC-type proline/glycine betaine transport system permease subunit
VLWYSFGRKPGLFGTHDNEVLSLDRYREALSGSFAQTFQNTLEIALLGTLLCFLIAFPFAYWLAVKVPRRWRALVLALVMVPFWTNFLVRTIGWRMILSGDGALSGLLQDLGVLGEPLSMLYTRTAVQIGVVYNYLPLMILPLFVALDRLDPSLREASKDLGASRWSTLVNVTLPLAAPASWPAAAGLHPADGRLHHRGGPRRRQGQHGRAAGRHAVPGRAELGARLGAGRWSDRGDPADGLVVGSSAPGAARPSCAPAGTSGSRHEAR